ncbi:NADPH-dependent F420 reductase [Nocardia colli]|uniref:NADPH-dependent F420 reductase n=1 Tax=Nocardia colli TaxID=2545717 RepID=UPI0035D81147
MRIGILGAGAMARALAWGWGQAGHEVMIGARSQDSAAGLAGAIGRRTRAGSLLDAARFGNVMLLALPADALVQVLPGMGDLLAGRTLIECSRVDSDQTTVGSDYSVAERISAELPKAHVVKAFNICPAEMYESRSRLFAGRRLAVPVCGDDPAAVRQVCTLVEDLKLLPIHTGPLREARYLDAVALFAERLWGEGEDVRAMFPPPPDTASYGSGTADSRYRGIDRPCGAA